MGDIVMPIVDGIATLPLWALALAVALAVAAESSLLVGLIVPGDVIVLLAAAGGTEGTSPVRTVVLVVAVASGSVVGEALGYAVGHHWGDAVRRSRPGRALGPERWDKAGRIVERHGARAVFGARWVAAVHAVLPVVAGTLHMPLRRFLGWSAAGAVAWSTVYVTLGAVAGASVRRAGDHMAQVTTMVMVAAAVVGAVLLLRTRRRREADGTGSATPVRRGTPAPATTALVAVRPAGGSTGSGVRAAAASASPVPAAVGLACAPADGDVTAGPCPPTDGGVTAGACAGGSGLAA
jgi:membrane-associated protein